MINNCFNLFIAFFRTPQIDLKLEVIIVFDFALEASLWPSLFTNFIFCRLNRESVRTLIFLLKHIYFSYFWKEDIEYPDPPLDSHICQFYGRFFLVGFYGRFFFLILQYFGIVIFVLNQTFQYK